MPIKWGLISQVNKNQYSYFVVKLYTVCTVHSRKKRLNNDSQTLLIQRIVSKNNRGHEGCTLMYTAVTAIPFL